jgi:hypothetical protein
MMPAGIDVFNDLFWGVRHDALQWTPGEHRVVEP